MSDACDKCGLEDPECHCYLYELEQRVTLLEEKLDKLMIEYPKNIHDWFSDGRDKEFSMWAFGCEQP